MSDDSFTPSFGWNLRFIDSMFHPYKVAIGEDLYLRVSLVSSKTSPWRVEWVVEWMSYGRAMGSEPGPKKDGPRYIRWWDYDDEIGSFIDYSSSLGKYLNSGLHGAGCVYLDDDGEIKLMVSFDHPGDR